MFHPDRVLHFTRMVERTRPRDPDGAEGSYGWTVTKVETRLSIYRSIYPCRSTQEEFENLDCIESFDYCGCIILGAPVLVLPLFFGRDIDE